MKDRNTGEKKGVCYVKFSKTSEAAKALEALNGRPLGSEGRSIKVVVASSKDKGNKRYADEEERYLRLFVIIPKDMTEDQLRRDFEQYGSVNDITILHNKQSKDGKLFAYVKFRKFSDTANAFENCDTSYKAVFAEPKPKNNEINTSSYMNYPDMMPHDRMGRGSSGVPPIYDYARDRDRRMSEDLYSLSNQETTLTVICSPSLTQDHLWRLFDIIPGLDYCRLNDDLNSRSNTATVVYSSMQSAKHAKDKLHGLEYPLGERLIVKLCPGQPDLASAGQLLADTFFNLDSGRDSSRDLACSVPLPPIKGMAAANATCRKRLFIVCANGPLPAAVLKLAFCRFGDLIEVFLLPGKNCGYALFASEASANDCISTLHGAEVCGIRLKVMEADEPKQSGRKRLRPDDI